MNGVEIITVTNENMDTYGFSCITSPKHPGYKRKKEWVKENLPKGLIVKLLRDGDKQVGFFEAIPGEHSWRAVEATGYLLIQCVWIYPPIYQKKGYASVAIKELINDAKKLGMKGVAAVSSEKPYLAGKSIYLKCGFKFVDSSGIYDLVYYPFDKNADPPIFKDWEVILKNYDGLNIIYGDQCPIVIKVVPELIDAAKEKGVKLNVIKIKDAKQAQDGPSCHGEFSIIYNGKIIADRYVSKTRFLNILRNEGIIGEDEE